MFNKSIVVALILCACYLSTIEAHGVLQLPLKTLEVVSNAEELAQSATNLGGKPGPISNLPVVGGIAPVSGLVP